MNRYDRVRPHYYIVFFFSFFFLKKCVTNNFSRVQVDESDLLNFVCLGGGNEVGRSCHIFSYKGKTVMVRTIDFHAYIAIFIILVLKVN